MNTYDDRIGNFEDIEESTKVPLRPKRQPEKWLVIGICLHDILSPVLRKYVESEVNQLYTSLVASNYINAQSFNCYLKFLPSSGNRCYLNYETINNNIASYGRKNEQYNYKVQNAVDFSKLFLPPNIAHYTAFDEACDLSALLGIIINVNTFPVAVQNDANAVSNFRQIRDQGLKCVKKFQMRSYIRNPWSHCDFTQWDAGKYAQSIQIMMHLVQNLGLISSEENRIIGDLNKWETTGINFLSGTTIGLELVTEIRHRTGILSKHIMNMAKHAVETDSYLTELLNINKALKETMDITDEKMLNLEEDMKKVKNKADIYGEMLDATEERVKALESREKESHQRIVHIENEYRLLEAEIERRDHETIPKHIRAQHDEYIQEWKRDGEKFVVTRATQHVYDSTEFRNCVVVTGESGSGPSDIIHYFNPKRNQVFVIDDICGKDSINISTVLLWKDHNDKLEQILRVDDDKRNANTLPPKETNRTILLISCRSVIFKKNIVHFSPNFCSASKPNIRDVKYLLMYIEKEGIRYKNDILETTPLVEAASTGFVDICKF
ncbi:unnamed protein product [Mytilus edulis]|uniref:DZIP3-like HEPN domain-containing protein n=1 Tax=Mytilus edulis TaxID=6550 RepID=A0A8S3U0D3_MYTED|nr:unnamed protein product [Mytilus edulis]